MFNKNAADCIPTTTQDVRSNRQRGASLVEYSLLVALIAVVSITAVSNLGTSVSSQYTSISEKLGGELAAE